MRNYPKGIYTVSVVVFFALLVGFAVVNVFERDYEFIFYSIVITILAVFILLNKDRLRLSPLLAAGLAIHGTLHLLGGNLYPDGVRLYDTWILPGLRWDNIVHMWGSLFASLIVYNLLPPAIHKDIEKSKRFIVLSLFLMTMGLGAVFELIELFAVVVFGATGVGDYLNNATDLLFNGFGAIVGCVLILFYHSKRGMEDDPFRKRKETV